MNTVAKILNKIQSESNGTLKGLYNVTKRDLPHGCKYGSKYENQLMWHIMLTEQRIKIIRSSQ